MNKLKKRQSTINEIKEKTDRKITQRLGKGGLYGIPKPRLFVFKNGLGSQKVISAKNEFTARELLKKEVEYVDEWSL